MLNSTHNEEASLLREQILKARSIDQYRLGELRGRGGFANVYEAQLRCQPSASTFAIKIVGVVVLFLFLL